LGGSGGIITRFYNAFRQKFAAPSPMLLKILGNGLPPVAWASSSVIYLVEHPLVARILARKGLLVFYIHGEIAAPKECAIPDISPAFAGQCFVPLESTKEEMVNWGAKPESIIVTGLVIEPELLSGAKKSFNLRILRLTAKEPLTVAFFISQAYPKPHIAKIKACVESVISKGMKAIVFSGTDPNKARQFQRIWLARPIRPDRQNLQIIMSKNRQEENKKTAELMDKIDIMVAAAHERTNWAIGLGLPMFVLFPLIGTYAQRNFDFALKRGVAYPLKTREDAKNLGARIIELQINGSLAQMAKNGFSVYNLNGARAIAEFIHRWWIHKNRATLPIINW